MRTCQMELVSFVGPVSTVELHAGIAACDPSGATWQSQTEYGSSTSQEVQ